MTREEFLAAMADREWPGIGICVADGLEIAGLAPWIVATSHPSQQSGVACKVCLASPDETGRIEHGRGCYVAQAEGGGVTYEEPV